MGYVECALSCALWDNLAVSSSLIFIFHALFTHLYQFLLGAEANVAEGIQLAECPPDLLDLNEIKMVADCVQAAASADVVAGTEELASAWCKQIEQVTNKESSEYMIIPYM